MAKRTSRPKTGFLLANRFFWIGLGLLAVIFFVLYLVIDDVVMPDYTRQDTAVTIPDVRNRSYDDASRILHAANLEVEQVTERFNPRLPRDVVIEQSPLPSTSVKPGRRVFLTVNSGQAPMVIVPPVRDLSLREAQNRLKAVGLHVEDMLPDTIPSPYPNTITRQQPAPGDSIPEGGGVRLWYSTGLGQVLVVVPDLTGLPVREASEKLLALKLRPVAVGVSEDQAEADQQEVVRQSREPGAQVREGSEVRIFTEQPDEVDVEAPEPLPQQ